MVIRIQIWFGLTRFRRDFAVRTTLQMKHFEGVQISTLLCFVSQKQGFPGYINSIFVSNVHQELFVYGRFIYFLRKIKRKLILKDFSLKIK